MPDLLSRILRRDPLFFFAWAALGGILMAFAEVRLPLLAVFGVSSVLLLAAWLRGWTALGVIGVGGLFLGWADYRRCDPETVAKLWAYPEAQPAELEGIVVETLDEAERGVSGVTLRVRRLSLADGTEIREALRCEVTGPLPALHLGERVRAKGMLKGLSPPRNPAERGRRGYARKANQAVAELQVVTKQRLRRDGVEWQGRVLGFAEEARESLSRTISKGLPAESEEVALLKAMVLGVTADISPESEDAFRRSGGMHIFSVSGLHVGIFGSVAWLILRAVGISRRPAIAVIVVLGGAYALVTGLQSPAVRAAIMLGVFLGGFVIRRQPRLLNSAGLAALVILAFDPHQAFSIGFQLSFAVLVAIGLLDGPMRAVTRRWLSPDPFLPPALVPGWRRRVQAGAQYFADIVTVSVAAFVGSGLLLWWYFGTVTPAGLIANCALIPLSWFVMALATLSMLLGACRLGLLSIICNRMNLPMVALVKQAAALFAALPGGHFEMAPASELWGAPDERVAEMVVFDSGLGCGPQAVRPAGDDDGGVWLIDCGDEAGYARTVRPWLRRHARWGLEGFVLTHADTAHVGGAGRLLGDFTVRRTFTGGGLELGLGLGTRAVSAAGMVRAGTRWRAGPETSMEVIFPPEGLPAQSRSDDECVVLLISLGPWQVLSMADSGFKTEKWILQHRPDLRADVVVMGRHGSDFCGLPEFFRAVTPRAVIATSTMFPASEMIPQTMRNELRKAGIALFDQERTGAVEIWREGQALVLRGFLDESVLRVDPGY